MRETSLPLTTPLPELSPKLDFLSNSFTKSVNEIIFGLFLVGFFVVIKFVSKIVPSRNEFHMITQSVDGVAYIIRPPPAVVLHYIYTT